MIERYIHPEMQGIWDIKSKFEYFLQVELAVCKAYNETGQIPDAALEDIIKNARFDIARIDEIEKEVKHDVIAFLTCVNENVGDNSRYIHMGLTSSDVIDTALALQIKKSSEIIEKNIIDVIQILKNKASEHKDTFMIGRSHGIHAEPITFAVKLCNWIDIFNRNLERFKRAAFDIEIGQISGPVGTYSNIDPEIEEITCKNLGLRPSKVSTQIIQRDLHAYYLQTLALIASTIEQFAVEIRHLQRTEVLEAEEGFTKGQKGSSAMPHKKNPIGSENLSGLSRVVRSNSLAALENIVLWHERDISHSSAERIIIPDSIILINYMLNRFRDIVENLNIHKENMKKNMNLYGGVVYSQRVLLALTDKGLSREEAYSIVQKNALLAWNDPEGSFKNNLLNDGEILKFLSVAEIEECFNPEYYLRNIDVIYKRMGI